MAVRRSARSDFFPTSIGSGRRPFADLPLKFLAGPFSEGIAKRPVRIPRLLEIQKSLGERDRLHPQELPVHRVIVECGVQVRQNLR